MDKNLVDNRPHAYNIVLMNLAYVTPFTHHRMQKNTCLPTGAFQDIQGLLFKAASKDIHVE